MLGSILRSSSMGGVGPRRVACATAVIATALCATTAEARRVVYLNTNGTTLVDTNGQDPTTNSFSSSGFTPGPISGWPSLTDQQEQLLLFLMKEGTVPFDITFTLNRPASGSYDMLVMGTAADRAALFESATCSAPVSLSDCEDTQGENISFLFYGCMSEEHQEDLRRVAHTALKALGYGWGLENVSVSGEAMGGYSGNALRFGNECVSISGSSQCFHEQCPVGQQNSRADLLAAIGPRVDDGPPSVEINSPAHLSVVQSDFVVDATVEDLFGGLEVTLEIVEADQQLIDAEPPYRWNLSSVPAGTWTLRVTAIDADGNEDSDEVVVCIGTDTCDPGQPPGDDEGTSGPGDGADTDETTGPDTNGGGGLDPTLPSGGSADGSGPAGSACHCRSNDSMPRYGALALLVLLARRRSRTQP
jgi:hypothetical protein